MTRGERRRRQARRARRQRMLLVTAVLAVATMCASFTFVGQAEEGGTVGDLEPQVTEVAYRGSGDDVKIITLPAVTKEPAKLDLLEQEEEDREEEPEQFFEEIPLDRDTQSCVMKWAEEYGVKAKIVLAVIQTESSFQADAQNGSCYGYMQINSINQGWLEEEIGVTDITDPYQNIQAGVYIWNKALTCYNCGEGGAYEHVFSKGETSTSYSRHVLDIANEWAGVVGDD